MTKKKSEKRKAAKKAQRQRRKQGPMHGPARPPSKKKKARKNKKKKNMSSPTSVLPVKRVDEINKMLAKKWALHNAFVDKLPGACAIPDAYNRPTYATPPFKWSVAVPPVQDSTNTADAFAGICMTCSPKSVYYTITAVANGVFTWTATDHPNAAFYTSATTGFMSVCRPTAGAMHLSRIAALSTTNGQVYAGRTQAGITTNTTSVTDVKPPNFDVVSRLKSTMICAGNNVAEGDLRITLPVLTSSGLVYGFADSTAANTNTTCCFFVWKGQWNSTATATNNFTATLWTAYEVVLNQLGNQNFPANLEVGDFDAVNEALQAQQMLLASCGCDDMTAEKVFKNIFLRGSASPQMEVTSIMSAGNVQGARSPNEQYLEYLMDEIEKMEKSVSWTDIRAEFAAKQLHRLIDFNSRTGDLVDRFLRKSYPDEKSSSKKEVDSDTEVVETPSTRLIGNNSVRVLPDADLSYFLKGASLGSRAPGGGK